MVPTRSAAPSKSPVTLEEMKQHGIICHDDDDFQLQLLIDAAVGYLDGYSGILGRCLVDQTWEQRYTSWLPCLRLPFSDVSVAVITYVDGAGDTQTVASEDFELVEDDTSSYVRFLNGFSFPALGSNTIAPITVALTAGYGGPENVPHALKVAIMMLASHWFENRSASGLNKQSPLAFDALISPYRRNIL